MSEPANSSDIIFFPENEQVSRDNLTWEEFIARFKDYKHLIGSMTNQNILAGIKSDNSDALIKAFGEKHGVDEAGWENYVVQFGPGLPSPNSPASSDIVFFPKNARSMAFAGSDYDDYSLLIVDINNHVPIAGIKLNDRQSTLADMHRLEAAVKENMGLSNKELHSHMFRYGPKVDLGEGKARPSSFTDRISESQTNKSAERQ
jgi:hypothetical protein